MLKETAATWATRIGSLPEAIGRLHLIGCRRSLSISARSLMRYTVLEARHSKKKPAIVFTKGPALNS